MIPYILSLFFYRLSNGCLILAVSWLLLNQSHTGEKNLVWVVISSFLPALLIAPMANYIFKFFSITKITVIGIFIVILIVFMMIFSISNPTIIIFLNFILWCIFFFLEGTWEAWFAEIMKSTTNQEKVKKLNSLSMTVSQVSLMLGPLLVGPSIRIFHEKGPFYSAICLYFMSIILVLYFIFSSSSFVLKKVDKKLIKQESLIEIIKKGPSLFLLASLIFVWPVLGMINMMLPIIGKKRLNGVVDKVAFLDAILCLGMAASGIFLAFQISKKMFSSKGIVILSVIGILSIIPLCLIFKNFNNMVFCMFAFGFTFGGLRIIMRNSFLEKLQPNEIGRIVTAANAFGFPIAAFFAFIYGFFPNFGELSPLMTYILFFGFLLLGAFKLKFNKYQASDILKMK